MTSFDNIDLLTFNLSVDINLNIAVCLQCHIPICPPKNIEQHVRDHLKYIEIPEALSSHLIKTYNLQDTPVFPLNAVEPVYGLPLHSTSHYFCGECHRGYSNSETLSSHQSEKKHSKAANFSSYAQRVKIKSNRNIPISLDNVPKVDSINIDYAKLVKTALAPQYDYTTLPIFEPEDNSNLSSFFKRDGWISLLQGHTPVDICDARRTHLPKEPTEGSNPCRIERAGFALRWLATNFLTEIQCHIQDSVSFGLMGYIGTTS